MHAMPETGSLDAVYGAKSPAEIAATYDSWADRYDAEMATLGYRHPTICLALLARHLPRGAAPILDAGAGTGLIGEWLQIMGYPVAEALDISEGMLRIATRKGVYDRLHRAALGERLPFEDGRFAAVICAGVFTVGHVGAEGLDELVRVVRPGGALVVTVKDKTWEQGFGDRVAELDAAGAVSVVEETPSYVSMPGRPDTVPSRGLVLRRRVTAGVE
jgi:predicted TPR repeat methyltransferase